jgi:hypothetical protein
MGVFRCIFASRCRGVCYPACHSRNEQPATLHIDVTDEHGAPVWARLEVRNTAGEMFQPAQSTHETIGF